MRNSSILASVLAMIIVIVPTVVLAQVPTLVAPSNGANNVELPVLFGWTMPGFTVQIYQLQVDDNSGFYNPEIDITTGAPTYSTSALYYNTMFYWRVRAYYQISPGVYVWGSYSAAWHFTTDCQEPYTPNLYNPPVDATDVAMPVYFDWNASPWAILFKFQLDDNSNFSSPIVNETSLTEAEYTVYGLNELTIYYWRAQSMNECNEWGGWSPTRQFTTSCSILDAPGNLNPDGDNVGNRPVKLIWSGVSGADSYQIQVDDEETFGSPVINVYVDHYVAPLGYLEYYAPGLSNYTLYYWRIRTENDCGGWGSFSSANYFYTECMTPWPPEAYNPVNYAMNVSQPVFMDWSDVETAVQYELLVYDEGDLGTPVVNISTASSSYTATTLEDGTTYLWMLRTQNSCGLGPWSYEIDDPPIPWEFTTAQDDVAICGDANGDNQVNVGDAVYVINYVFKGGPAPNPLCAGDANGDGQVNVGDAVYLISYVFKGGPPPVNDCCP
jgi:hypothetical protein